MSVTTEPGPSLRGRLHHLQLGSPQPERLADFYGDVLAMTVERDGKRWVCRGPDRCLVVVPGEARTLATAAYRLGTSDMLDGLVARLRRSGMASPTPCADALLDRGAVAFADPDGNRLVFGLSDAAPPSTGATPTARLQHVVVGSPAADALAAFYADVVGFRLSDRVLDSGREVRTSFLRSDAEHHSFAVFQTEGRRFDHHCYEVPDWNAIRDWADRLAARRIAVEWGPGRHGPGNNLFLFFHDPDGNWLELSAELERVPDGRPAGAWRHEERTLEPLGSRDC